MNFIFIILLCLIIRIIPRIIRPYALASDTCLHLYMADEIYKHRYNIPKTYDRMFFNNIYDYPFLYHVLLAIFPPKYRTFIERFSPAFFDTITLIIIYFFSTMLETQYCLYDNFALCASVAFCFHPALLKFGNGPRIHYGSPRVLGQMLYVAHIFTAWYGITTPSIIILLLSALFIIGITLTSKFCFQVLVFFAPFLAIFWTPLYLILLIVGIFFSIIFTKGHAFRIIHGSLRHSIYYYKYLQKPFVWPSNLSYKQYFSNVLSKFKGLSKGDKTIVTYVYTSRNPLNVSVLLYPELVFTLIPLSFSTQNSLPDFIIAIVFAGISLLFLTELKPFMFLGDGERYMQYASPFLCILSSYYIFMHHTSALILFIFIGILFYIFGIINFVRECSTQYANTAENITLFKIINELPIGYILPIGSVHWLILLKTKHNLIVGGLNLSERILQKDDFKLLYENYPLPSSDITGISNRFNPQYILASRGQYESYKKLIKDNELCELYEETTSSKQFIFFTRKQHHSS